MTDEIKKENSDQLSVTGDHVVDDEKKDHQSPITDHKEKQGLFHRKCKKCGELEKQCEEYKSGWQRALADYKNLQREVEQRRGEWVKMSEVEILEDFIPIYENFKQAFLQDFTNGQSLANSANDGWKKGIECIKKQFLDVLKQHGVEEIKTVGEKFDPVLHEAVGEAPSSDGVSAALRESGTIVKEVSGGYKMGGKVIRAARVIVAK